MTTSDDRTIADGAVEFWRVSGNDLFALADKEGRIVALDTKDPQGNAGLRSALRVILADPARHYLVSEGRLFRVLRATPLFWQRTRWNAAWICHQRLCNRSRYGRSD